MRRIALALVLSTSLSGAAIAAPGAGATAPSKPAFSTPLPEEPIPASATLPRDWPASWVMVHDFNFASIVDGRVYIIDTASPERPVRGMVRAAQFANMLVSRARGEILTSETFYSRLSRGERTDAVTIWDMATLEPKGEIVMPGGKRQQSVTYPQLFQFTNGGKWALVANFTPAQSVSVLDLDARKIVSEIDLPGCAQIYPTGERGFTSLCADGSMLSMALGPDGQVTSSRTIEKIQDIDHHPLFSTPAWVGQTAWFVSFYGQVQGFDFSGPVAKPLPGAFSVGTADGGAPEWRPGGWQVIASDAKGLLYVLMSANGHEGSHKDGGNEVWVLDPVKKARIARIPLRSVAVAISVTREAVPHLVVVRGDGDIDVHDAATGALAHGLGHVGGSSPILITPVP